MLVKGAAEDLLLGEFARVVSILPRVRWETAHQCGLYHGENAHSGCPLGHD